MGVKKSYHIDLFSIGTGSVGSSMRGPSGSRHFRRKARVTGDRPSKPGGATPIGGGGNIGIRPGLPGAGPIRRP